MVSNVPESVASGKRACITSPIRAALASHGVRPVSGGLDGVSKVVFLEYDKGPARKEYWIGFDNFYVITRYNRSPLYAMAVYQLAEALKKGEGSR
jgi:membrane-bound lytic murein transglycosylase B